MALIKNITSGSINGVIITGSLSVSDGITGSLFGTASWALNTLTASYVLNAVSASYSSTSSYLNTLNQDVYITGSVFINGTASIDVLNVRYITSSIIYSSGSNQLGDNTDDVQTLIGTVIVSGSQQVTGALYAPEITGSLYGTASWAENALTASYTPGITSNGTQYYLPVWKDSSSLGTSSLYESGSVLKTVSGSSDVGLKLDFANNIYTLGDNSNGLYINTPNAFALGNFAENNNGTYLLVDDAGENIRTIHRGQDTGINLDFQSGIYKLGDHSNISGSTKLVIDDNAQTITISGSLNAPVITGSLHGTASWALNAQTASNILGGKAPHVPFFITDTTLATSSIYQSGSSTVIINQDAATTANPEALYVWQPSTSSFNVISGKGNLDNYLQLNIQNTNQGPDASSDIVATANNGNESVNYIDMGINSENYAGFLGGPNDAYLYSAGENLWIGNYSDGKNVYFFNSSSEDALITLTPSNTVDINTTLNAPDITGSLEGTASWAKNVISASHAVNADFAGYAQAAGVAANGGVTQIVAGSGVSLIPSSGVGAVTVIATGVGGVTILSGSNVTESFVNSTTWNFNHNLGVRTPVISVFDSNYNQVIPESIQLVDATSSIITFPTPESGFAIATVGGVTGNALSASYSLFATYADTASFYAETDPIYIAQKPTLATTGSNVFRGTQTISGSVILVNGATGSLLGTASFASTASNSISSSYASNADLLDGRDSTVFATTGSNIFIGTQIVTGSLFTSGSNTLIGNTILSGSFEVSGSTILHNSTFIVTGSTFINGTTQITGSTGITGSFSVRDGNIDIVSGSSFTRWGNKLFNYGAFSDYTTQSGSANTAHAITFNTTDVALGVSLSGSSAIKIENTGIYNFQWSGQANEGAGAAVISIWLRVNGNDVPGSRGDISLGSNNAALPAWNYVLPFNANDAVELYWSSTSANTTWVFSPPAINPTRPSTASIIATITQIA